MSQGSEPHPTSLDVNEEENMEPLLKKHGWFVFILIFYFNHFIVHT